MEIYNGKKTHSTFHDNSTNIKKNNDKKKEGFKKNYQTHNWDKHKSKSIPKI